MVKRIFAICFIFGCTAVAWFILSGTILVRTETQDSKLRGAVGQLWGTEQTQQAPKFYYESKNQNVPQMIEASDINTDIKLDYRKKGLLWYSTYKVKFTGKYQVRNDSDEARQISMDFKLPAQGAIYDNFQCVIKGQEIEDLKFNQDTITKSFTVAPRQVENIQISYESQGLSRWSYNFGENVNQVKNFSLVLNTNFEEIDFPADSISPTSKERAGTGWKLTWQYSNLLTGFKIGMLMPQKLNPGPWVSRVTVAAPVSLFLFFFLLFIFTTVRNIKIHPMNYFFVAAAFFSFHLLLAYLIDHIDIHLAFWICSLVSVFLVVSYMRLVVGRRFAFIEVALSQLIYLVFFSYTFFFEGYTGLAITILCICTLFIVMQATGKVDWSRLFEKSEHK
jgi:hypothetical protein